MSSSGPGLVGSGSSGGPSLRTRHVAPGSHPVAVETKSHKTQVWLIKLPPTLRSAWREALIPADEPVQGPAAAPSSSSSVRRLGVLRLETQPQPKAPAPKGVASNAALRRPPPPKQPARKMTIFADVPDTEPNSQGGLVTQEFTVNYQEPPTPLMLIRELDSKPTPAADGSIDPDEADETNPKYTLAIQGQIKFNCTVLPLEKSRAQVRAVAQSAAQQEKPQIQVVDALETKTRAIIAANEEFDRNVPSVRRRPGTENVARIPREELQEDLFRLFEDAPFLALRDIHAATRQPEQYLRDVLSGIAIQNKRGQRKGLWQLLPEYQSSSHPRAPTGDERE